MRSGPRRMLSKERIHSNRKQLGIVSDRTFDSHFNKSGVAFTFSAGDAGYGTSYPAASPYVTAVGGTSLSAPLIAAVYALQGAPPAQANAAPYNQGTAANLHDVVTGSNGSCGNYLCTAQIGYDGPTGLGTPNGTSAF